MDKYHALLEGVDATFFDLDDIPLRISANVDAAVDVTSHCPPLDFVQMHIDKGQAASG